MLLIFSAVLQFIEEQKEVVSQSISAAFAVTFVFNIFLNSALGQLWSLVNALQILIYLPLMSIGFPMNTRLVCSILIQVATLDIFPTDLVYGFFYSPT